MSCIVNIRWSGFIPWGSKLFKERGVLYMYATRKMSVYIGEAATSTVRDRLKNHIHHREDFVVKWIRKNIPHRNPCRIKVGRLHYNGLRLPYCPKMLELLHDIQSLLIFSETGRGFCLANVSNTKSRKWCRPGMKVVNSGSYKPLLRTYRDFEKLPS